MAEAILALNAGSSSLKFALFVAGEAEAGLVELASGGVRPVDGHLVLEGNSPQGPIRVDARLHDEPDAVVGAVLAWADVHRGAVPLTAAGHRIVHGGPDFAAPVEIDDEVLRRLTALTPLAPLHQPACLAPAHSLRALRPQLRQVACFDTAFHRTMTAPASRYALPRRFEARGIRRYGFHGLSYQSIADRLRAEGGAMVDGRLSRVIVAHLGNGASLCALRGLESVDTTMGFSVLDGLVMGTRAGVLDPGILLHLLRTGMSAAQLEDLLYRQSGLLGVSGLSADVRVLLASTEPAAAEALELFAFQAAKQAAALATTLGGIDQIVFTGGIGEHSPEVRAMIAERLGWLGAALDPAANAAGSGPISAAGSPVLIECRPAREEWAVARHTWLARPRAA